MAPLKSLSLKKGVRSGVGAGSATKCHSSPTLLKAYYVWTKTRNFCYLKAKHGGVAGSPDLGGIQGAEVLWETDGPIGFDSRLLYRVRTIN